MTTRNTQHLTPYHYIPVVYICPSPCGLPVGAHSRCRQCDLLFGPGHYGQKQADGRCHLCHAEEATKKNRV